MDVIVLCSNTAARAHDGHYRKDGETPYFSHEARVYGWLCIFGASTLAKGMGLMHDVQEDIRDFDLGPFYAELSTLVSADDVRTFKAMLDAITKSPKLEAIAKSDESSPSTDERRHARDKENYERILRAPPETILVKLCDRIDNLQDMDGFDEKFIARYLRETDFLIGMLGPKAIEYGYTDALEMLKSVREMKGRE